jgi:hypothetical protein
MIAVIFVFIIGVNGGTAPQVAKTVGVAASKFV